MNRHDNLLKAKLKKNQPVFGTWNTLGSPLVTEVLAKAGLDFVIIDFEHGPFQIHRTSEYVNSCLVYDCTPIIRIPENKSWMSLQALDQGAHGVILPGVKDKKSALKFSNQIKYDPLGSRGFSPFTKSGGFNNSNRDYKRKANDLTNTIIIIENMEGLNNLDEILEVDSIDIIYFGAYDLSQSLGFAGDVYNDKLISIVKKGIDKVLRSKKYAGGFVPQSIDEIKMVRDLGINFITYNVDANLMYESVNKITNWLANNK